MKTRDRILKTARALFNAHRFGNVTTADLARECGIAEGNLWYHFKNKRALLDALTEQFLEDVDGRSVTGQEIASGAPPALINAYAQVVIRGADTDDAFRIPSTALRGGDTVWLYDEGTLSMAPAEAIHVDGEDTYIAASALPVGSRIITSQHLAPIDGMPVRNVSDRRQADLAE